MIKTFLAAASVAMSFSAAQATSYSFHYDYGPAVAAEGLSFVSFRFDGTLHADGNTVLINSIGDLALGPGVIPVDFFGSASSGSPVPVENSFGGAYVTLDGTGIDLTMLANGVIAFIFDTEGLATAAVNSDLGLSLGTAAGIYSIGPIAFDEFIPANLSVSTVPLPAAAPLLLAALGGLSLMRRRS